MELVNFEQADQYSPEEGWERIALAGDEAISLEWFTKPPGHQSPMHNHENEQVCVVLQGELTIHTEDDTQRAEQYDSVYLESWEEHSVENEGDTEAIGLDIFVPGRSFDYWLDRED